MNDVNRYRVTLEYSPGSLAPTFPAICFAHSAAEAEQQARELAAECGWWNQIVTHTVVREESA